MKAFLTTLALLFAGQVHANEALTYDANGNIETRTLPSGTTTYQYDDLDRVQSEAGPAKIQSFTWDPNGNRTGDASGTHTYTPNSNRQATIAGQSVTLDQAGNIIQARNLGFVWNTQGQLIEVRQGSPSGAVIASYSYDHQNRRTRKIRSGNGSLVSRTTIYTYDQYDRLTAEFNGAGSPLRTYVWRDSTPLAVIEHSGTEAVYYIETDHLSSPIAVKDKDGTVIWRWESEAFGATAPNQDADGDGNAFVLNLRFPGQYYDAESGLHYNHHRYYDPKIGRYISSDPIGLAGGLNTYSYVKGNPLRYNDPLGLAIECKTILKLGIADIQECAENGKTPSEQSAKDAKRMSNKELDKACKNNGYKDAHDFKRDLDLGSDKDIFVDRDGNMYAGPRKGPGTPEYLHMNTRGITPKP